MFWLVVCDASSLNRTSRVANGTRTRPGMWDWFTAADIMSARSFFVGFVVSRSSIGDLCFAV